MQWIKGWIALAVLASLAAPASARGGSSTTLAKGRWSVAFSLPEGRGAELGVWNMVSDRSNVGLSIGVDHQFDVDSYGPDSARLEFGHNFWNFSLQPSIKRYIVLRERVSPFVKGALRGSYGWSEVGSRKVFFRSYALSAGLGVDWTPLDDVSIGASTGVAWTEAIYSGNDFSATKTKISTFDTETGALTLHLYF